MRQRAWPYAVLLIGVVILASCQPLSVGPAPTTPQASPPIQVQVVTVTVGPSPTPGVCTTLPVGARWEAELTGPRRVRMVVEGMPPGDALTFRYIAPTVVGHTREIVATHLDKVDAAGRFTTSDISLDPLPGTLTNTWQIQMTHGQGLACLEVTLP